jgi:high-affinity iron transporter
VLHTLVGYSDQPSVLQVIVYLATLATIFALAKAFAPRRGARRADAPAPQRG